MGENEETPDAWTPPPIVREPGLRTPGPESENRHATWLELFYDLVFVAAVGGVAEGLVDDLTPGALLRFVLLFYAVWWAWVGHTVFATRFDTDDVPDRLLTLGVMLGAAGMAVQLPLTHGERGFFEQFEGFALAYVVARVFLILLYLRVHVLVPKARPITRVYLQAFTLGTALWFASVFVPPAVGVSLWVGALLVELFAAWAGRATLRRAPVDASHLPERFGLFTLIVLGESVVAIVAGVSGVRWHPASVATAILVFLVVAAIWWLYFTFVRTAPLAGSLGSGQRYAFAHLPLLLALAALGDGLLHVIVKVAGTEPPASALWLTGGALALWVVAFLVVQHVGIRTDPMEPPIVAYLAAAVALLALTAVAPLVGAYVLLAGATLIFGALATVQVRQWEGIPEALGQS